MEIIRTKKETIKNLYFARKALNYNEYKKMGGQGTQFEYNHYIHMNKLKAEQKEALLNELYGN